MTDLTNPKGSIFRTEAVRRYVESQERSVLPRLVSPPTFLYLWSLLGLLAASTAIAWSVKIPSYISGSAAVTRLRSEGRSSQPVAVAFFPPQYLSKLQASQKLFLKLDRPGESRLKLSILSVQILSPKAIQKQFALNPSIDEPAVAVIASWELAPSELPLTAYLGTSGRAEVEIGTERVISLLPMLPELFNTNSEK